MAIAFIRRSRLSFSCADGQHDYRWGGTADIHQQCVICDAIVDGSAHTYKVKYTWQDNHENGCTAENSCVCGYVKNTETSSDVSTTTHAATCTEDEWYTCTAKFSTLGSAVCGTQHVIEGTATGHDPSDYTYDTAAHWKNCNTCGIQLDYATHTSVTDSGYDATCTEDGLTDGSHCSVCDMVIIAQETIDATGHDWGEWIVDEEATETENGSKHHVCSNCDEEETAVIPALGHTTHTEVIIKGYDATCTSTGLTDGVKCSVCETIITPQEVIPLKDHSEVTVPGHAATCTASGLTDGVECSVCGKVITAQTSIARLNHSYTNYTSDGNATCAQDGTKTAFCDYGCGNKQTVTDVNSKLNVAHTEVIDNAVEATCTTSGLTVGKHCAICNAVLIAQQTVPAKGHTEEIIPGAAATCRDAGLTEGKKCSVCGVTLVAQQEIPTSTVPHTYDDKYDAVCNVCGYVRDAECAHLETETIVGKAATCTESGLTNGTKCKNCGEILVTQETIEATGHTYESEITAPTCTEGGYTTYTCHCGDSYIGDYTGILGHSIDEGSPDSVDRIEPTCTTSGSETRYYTCDRCNEPVVEEEILPATGHTEEYENGEVCECTRCGAVDHYYDPSAAPDSEGAECFCSRCDSFIHEWSEVIDTVDATCTEPGGYHKQCNRCDITEFVPTSDALGHSPGKEATCTEDQTCTRCGEVLEEATGHGTFIGGVCEDCGYECTHENHDYEHDQCTCPDCGESVHNVPEDSCTCSACGDLIYEHDYVISEEEVAPTCTEPGRTAIRNCGRCGAAADDSGDEIEALGHTGGTATCTTQAKCTRCGSYYGEFGEHSQDWEDGMTCYCDQCESTIHHYTTDPGDPDNPCYCEYCGTVHDWVISVEATEPTCTEDGNTEGKYCGTCGETIKSEIIDALGHEWFEGVCQNCDTVCTHDVDEDTCQCMICDEYIHNYVDYEYVAPTCEKDGHEGGYYCTRCGVGEDYTVIPATGHDFSNLISDEVSPTCTEVGYTAVYECGHCGDRDGGDELEALGHEFDESAPEEDICLCTRCQEYIHNLDGCTCTDCGAHVPVDADDDYRCDYCGESLCDEHDWVTSEEEVAPTCTDVGYKAVRYCGNCGVSADDSGDEIPALGHQYEEDSCECTVCGVANHNMEGCECLDCDYTEHTINDYCECTKCWKTFHSYVDCVCEICGDDIHEWESGECMNCGTICDCDELDADCVCVRCGSVSHSWDPATCTEPKTCSVCGATYGSELGHNYQDNSDAVAATCGTDGCTSSQSCSRCGDTIAGEVIPATGEHNFEMGSTCETCGYVCTHPNYDPEHDEVCPDCDEYISSGGGGTPVEPDACLIASTPILMADGSEKAISQVRAGDMVKSWDIENNEYIDVKVLGAYCTGTEQDWSVHTFDNGRTLDISNEHRIFCKEKNSVRQSTDWRAGNTAISFDGAETKYYDVDVRHDDHATNRYTMLTENNLYFANGILCGHHAKSKYKFVNKGWLEATPEELEQYRSTAALYDELDKAFTNEEYLKEAAPLREQLLRAKEDIRLNRHEISKLKRGMDKQKRSKLSRKDQDAFDNKRNSYRSNARSIKDNNKAVRAQLDELKTKFGITTKSKYQIWKEAYDLDMNYIKNRSAK